MLAKCACFRLKWHWPLCMLANRPTNWDVSSQPFGLAGSRNSIAWFWYSLPKFRWHWPAGPQSNVVNSFVRHERCRRQSVDSLESEIFSPEAKACVNDFIGVMVSEPGSNVSRLVALLHRSATAESIVYPILCSVFRRENSVVFHYRCQRCANFQPPQGGFWNGSVSFAIKTTPKWKITKTLLGDSKHTANKFLKSLPEKLIQTIPHLTKEQEKNSCKFTQSTAMRAAVLLTYRLN